MTGKLHVPKRACGSCPYHRDTPSGVWAADHYQLLATYDEQPGQTPALATFHCHQENATGRPTVCRGWLSTHRDSVAVRLALCMGKLQPADVPTQPEPDYYGTGTEASLAGLAEIDAPSPEAQRLMDKLLASGAGVQED